MLIELKIVSVVMPKITIDDTTAYKHEKLSTLLVIDMKPHLSTTKKLWSLFEFTTKQKYCMCPSGFLR